MRSRTFARSAPVAALAVLGVLYVGGGASSAQDTAPADDRERYAFSSVGFVGGETLRISVASLLPPPVPDVPPPTNDRVRIGLVDADGHRVADTGVRALAPGRTLSFDVAREQLGTGSSRNARLQVRAVVIVAGGEEGLPPSPIRTSAEVVNGAGRTTVFIPPPIHDIPPPVTD